MKGTTEDGKSARGSLKYFVCTATRTFSKLNPKVQILRLLILIERFDISMILQDVCQDGSRLSNDELLAAIFHFKHRGSTEWMNRSQTLATSCF